MVNEYLEPLFGAFPSILSDEAAAALGESRTPTGDALSICRSAILSSLTAAARVPDVARAVLTPIVEAADEIPRLADLSQLYQGRLQPTSLGALAKSFLGILFGRSLADITGQIAQSAAIKPASAASLLEMTATHLLPALGFGLKAANAATPAGLLQNLEGISARWPRDVPAWLTDSPWQMKAAGTATVVAAGAGLTKSVLAGVAPSANDVASAGNKISAAITPLGEEGLGRVAAAAAATEFAAKAVDAISGAAATIPANLADEILASAAHAKISEAITPLEARPATGITAIETAGDTRTVKTGARTSAGSAAATPPRTAHPSSPAPHVASEHERRGGGWIWALPVLLLLGTAGWWLWGQPVEQIAATAPAPVVAKKVPLAPVARVEAPQPPPAPSPKAVEQAETVVGPPGRTEYYGESSTFAAEVWTNPDYSAVQANSEPAPVEPAVETAVAEPVPGHTELYDAGPSFAADVWVNPDYEAQEAAAEPAPPAAEEPVAEELPPPVPGHSEFYAASEPFTADVWTNADYAAETAAQAPPEPEAVAMAVPGRTEFYEAGAPFIADVWTNPDYAAFEPAAAPVEVHSEPVPGRTEYYEATESFTADVWSNPDYETQAVQIAAAEPLPPPAAGKTEFYAAAAPFAGEVWSNPDYKVAAVTPPTNETVVKCQSTLNGALSPIRFKTARADLTDDGRSALDKMAEAIKQCPGVTVRVEGHTDSDGETAFNQELSEARAKSVVAYLASVGVDAARLKPEGFGETRPIASNDDDAGKARNRRIDFVVEEH